MKKILFAFFVMFVGFIKAEAVSPVVDYDMGNGIYSNRIGDKLYSGKMGLITLEGHVVYCLEPFELVGRTYYEDSVYLQNMNQDDLNYFELVAYFGYNTTNRNSIYYYMAAQEIIWERIIGHGNIYWTTEENGMGNRIDISSYKKEILDNIDNFNTLPTFHNNHYSLDYFEEQKLIDQNKVLTYYNFNYLGKNQIRKENNNFSIKMLSELEEEIVMTRNIKTDNKTTIYTGRGNQTLAKFGIDRTIKSSIFISNTGIYKTNLILNFYDKETNEIISDVDFKICNNEEIIDIYFTHTDHSYIFNNNISVGKYSICELDDKYILNKELSFDISKEDLLENTVVNLYLEKETIKEFPKEEEEKEIDIDIPIVEEKDDLEIPIEEEKEDDIEISIDEKIEQIQVSINKQKKEENKNNDDIDELPQIITSGLDESDKEIKKQDLLPNTNNKDLPIYLCLFLLFTIGIIIYEKENWA